MKKGKISFFLGMFVLCSMTLAGESPGLFTLSAPPGSYRNDIRLEIAPKNAIHTIRYRFKESRSDRLTNYLVPLVLSSLQGEERPYTLHIQVLEDSLVREEIELSYKIDKKAPVPPVASLSHEEMNGHRRLRFSHPENAKIFYSFEPDRTDPFGEWDGFSVTLPVSRSSGDTLFAYAQDPAGNRSALVTWTSRSVDIPPGGENKKLEVLSPLPGRFLNRQMLVIDHEGYEWVRYSINGTDPEKGPAYIAPTEIREEGDLNLRIAAKENETGRIERRNVSFSQKETGSVLKNLLIEEKTDLPLSSFGIEYTYCLEERSPASFDAPAVGEIPLFPQEGAVRHLPLRIRSLNEPTHGGEYRYFLTLNGKIPGEVFIDIDNSRPLSGEPVLLIRGGPEVDIRYTLDNSDPGFNSSPYTVPRPLVLPKDRRGVITVKARAFYSDTRYGPMAEKKIVYKTDPPAPPVLSRIGENSQGYLAGLCRTEPGTYAVYEIAWGGGEPADPDANSPRIGENPIIKIPHGYTNDVALKFAAVDDAGNSTPHPETLRVRLNRLPPEEPQISVSDGIIYIQGEGQIYSRIIEEGIPGGIIDMRNFSPYFAPIALPLTLGRKTEYRVEAYTEDGFGNRSAGQSVYRFSVDRRIPSVPAAAKETDHRIIVNTGYTLDFSRRSPDLDLYYTFTEDGSEPREPDTSSFQAGDTIVFPGRDSQRVHYRVKVLSRFAGSPEQGLTADFNFIIDKEPPGPPKILGVPPSNIVNHGVEISMEPAEEEDSIFYRIGKNTSPDTSGWLGYEEPVRMEPWSGETVLYQLEYYVKDRAGNMYRPEKPISLIIDQKPPAPPRIKNPPQKGNFSSPLALELEADEGVIHYEISTDGTLPKIPEHSSPVYQEPILIGEENTPVYSIFARTSDEAGNLSSSVKLTDFHYSPFSPGWTPEPKVSYWKKGFLISWEDAGDRFLRIPSGPNNTKIDYNAPIFFPQKEEMDRVVYFVEDSSGNPGEERTLVLKKPAEPEKPEIEGPAPGRYGDARNLHNRTVRGTVRYEMTADGSEPMEVTFFSPLFGETLKIDSVTGETVHYRIHLKTFSEDTLQASEREELSYIIDRTPPSPPVLHGVLNNNYYAQDRTAELHGEAGKIFYEIRKTENEFKSGTIPAGGKGAYIPYEGPFRLGADEGSLAVFYISAYTVDEVGNRSLTVPGWNVIIDKAVVYVSRQGRDDFDGSRSRPVRNLHRAISILNSTKRSAVYLEKGTHVLGEPLKDFKSYKIIGGFDRDTWQYAGIPSTILYQPEENSPFLRVSRNSIHIENLLIKDLTLTHLNLIHMDAGILSVKGCTFHVSGTVRGLFQDGGSLFLENTEFKSDFLDREELIYSKNAVFKAINSRFSYEQSGTAGNVLSLRYARGSSLDMVSLVAGPGLVSTGIHTLSSELAITNSAITVGKGRLASIGIKCDEGSLTLDKVAITLPKGAYISTALSVVNANLFMKNSALTIAGNYGATGLYSKNSRVDVTGSVFEGAESEDFLYYLHMEGTTGSLKNNSFRGGNSGDFIGAILVDSSTEWANNMMNLGIGRTTSMGFLIKGLSQTDLYGNSIGDDSSNGIIFNVRRESDAVRIENNRLRRGNVILLSDNPSAGWSRSPTTTTIRDIEGLNAFSRPGGTFKDNYSWDQTGRIKSEE